MNDDTEKLPLEIQLHQAREEIAAMRVIFTEVLDALGTGAFCGTDVSLGFLKEIPGEVKGTIALLKADADRHAAIRAEFLKFAKDFCELFCYSDMRPEDECHDLYSDAYRIIAKIEGGTVE
jgi:hypothetical protein